MKERLTGAIILVALMVLLVPELLTGPIRTKSAAAGRKAPEQPPLRTYTLTLGAAPAPQASGPVQAAQAQPHESSQESAAAATVQGARAAPAEGPRPQQRAVAEHAPAEPAASRAPGLQAAKSAAPPLLREASAAASSRGWVVQLGSFADRQNAVRLARSLEARGFRMSVSPGRAGSRILWRVRAGPAHDRAGAQHLAARLRALGHRGEVLPSR